MDNIIRKEYNGFTLLRNNESGNVLIIPNDINKDIVYNDKEFEISSKEELEHLVYEFRLS